uniref:Uncharacterized protein n=1 Tax=Arundo donax TaxID=35708 RepID=A0A0A9HV54_ARUDO
MSMTGLSLNIRPSNCNYIVSFTPGCSYVHLQYFAGMALSFLQKMSCSSSEIFSCTTQRRTRRSLVRAITLW